MPVEDMEVFKCGTCGCPYCIDCRGKPFRSVMLLECEQCESRFWSNGREVWVKEKNSMNSFKAVCPKCKNEKFIVYT